MRRATLAAELVGAALRYVERGYPVFPCRPDKRPFTAHGFKDASRDQDQVRAWWSRWPLAMIGMPTGSVSGVVVIDVDVKNGVDGFATLHTLGRIETSVMVRTPSGGAHLYFRASTFPVKNSAGKFGPGVDVRGDGGYVILPPSRPTLTGDDYYWEEGYDAL